MKKLSKILAVLLTVCVLVGAVVATVASAETTSQLDASQYGNNITNVLSNSDAFKNSNNSNIFGNNTSKYSTATPTNNQNTYYRYYYTEKASDVTSLGGNAFLYSDALNLQNNDYTVIDFDISSDKYIDENKLSDTGTKLAYPEKLPIYHLGLGSGCSVYLVYDEASSAWYASSDGTYSSNDIPLANEPGVWNHLTFVIKTDSKGSANGYIYAFVDGQFLNKAKTANLTSVTSRDNSRLLIGFGSATCNAFSFAIDNVAVNTYGSSESSYTKPTNCNYSIVDYFGGETVDTSIPLYKCEDIVYNANYVYPSNAEAQTTAVKLVTAAGETSRYSVFEYESALKELTALDLNGATIYTRKNIDVDALDADAKGFKIISSNGAIATSSNYTLVSHTNADGTTTYTINPLLGSNLNDNIATPKWQFNTKSSVYEIVGEEGLQYTYEYITSNNNTYFKYHLNETTNGVTAVGKNGKIIIDISGLYNYDYTTIDFDFASDMYIGDGKLEDTGTKLAYPQDFNMYHYGMAGKTKVYFVYDEKSSSWFISKDGSLTDGEGDIPLANEAGVWNHLTYVIKTVGDDPSTATGVIYTYIDGQFLMSSTLTNAQMNLTENRYLLSFLGVKYDVFSLAFDNFAINRYGTTEKSYTKSEDCEYSITDYFGGNTVDTSKPLYDCEDIVFNKYYYFGAPKSQDEAISITKGDVTTSYNVFEYLDAIKALANESSLANVTITTRMNLDLTALGKKVLADGFKVIPTNGAVPTSSLYTAVEKDGEYTFKAAVTVEHANGDKDFYAANEDYQAAIDALTSLTNTTIYTSLDISLDALGDKVLAENFKVIVSNGATVTCAEYRVINSEGTVTFDYPVKVTLSDETVKNFTVDELKKLTAAELKDATITTSKPIDVDTLVYGAESFTVVLLDDATVTGYKYIKLNGTTTYVNNQLDMAHLSSDITNVVNYDQDNHKTKFTISGSNLHLVLKSEYGTYTNNSNATNGYVSITDKGADIKAPTGNHSPYIMINGDMSSSKYYVVDFDISNVVIDDKLNYLSSSYFNGSEYNYFAYFIKDKESGNYYMSLDKNLNKSVDAPLASDADIWNHITYVLPLESSSPIAYVFLDGKYLGTKDLELAYNSFSRLTFNFSGIGSNNYDVSCNISIDNITINAYGDNYKSSEGSYRLIDYISEIDTTTKNLFDCEDVVFNKGEDVVFNKGYKYYVAPEAQNVAVSVGDKSWGIFDDYISEIDDYITEGATIVTRKNLNGLELPSGLSFVYVQTDNGAVISLSGDAYGFRESDNANYRYVIYNANSKVNVTWKYGDKTIHTSTAPIGFTLEIPTIFTPVYIVDGKYYVFQEWNSEYLSKAVESSDFVVEAVYTEKTFDELGLKFTVITKDKLNPTYDTLFTTLELGIDKYTDVKNSVALVNALEAGATAEVVLYADFDNMGATEFDIKGTVTFDLNGHDIKQLGKIGDSTRTPMFSMNDGCTFNLKSSVPDAELYQLQWRSGGVSTDISFGLVYAGVDVDGYNININGDGISFYAGSVIMSEYEKNAGNDKQVKININGGKYYSLALTSGTDRAGALFALHAANVTCTVNNITAVTAEKSITAIFALTANTKLNVSNSTLVDASEANNTAIITSISANSSVEFTKCSFIGYHFAVSGAGFSGKLILNEGNKFDARMDIVSYYITNKEITVKKGYQFALGGNTEISTDGIQYPTVTYPETLTDGKALVTLGDMINIDAAGSTYYLEIRPDSEIATVTWKKPDGTDYRVEKWIKGSNLILLDVTVFGVKETYNNWYDEVYSVWLNGKTPVNDGYELTADITLTPAGGHIIEDITAIRYNMTLTSSFTANLYVPEILGVGMEFLGFYSGLVMNEDGVVVDEYGNLKSLDGATLITLGDAEPTLLGGRNYTTYSFAFDTDAIDENKTVYVVLKVTVNKVESIIYKEVNISLLGYAEAIIKAYKCGSDESILAYNLINYANEAYKFNKGDAADAAVIEKAVAFLEVDVHAKFANCTCDTKYTAEETPVNTADDAFRAYASDISYEVSKEYPGFVLTLAEGSTVTGGKVTVSGNEFNMTLSADGKHLYADIPLYLVSDTMTFTIEGVSCDFNLAAYATSDKGNIPVINALYSLSVIAKDYKDNTND